MPVYRTVGSDMLCTVSSVVLNSHPFLIHSARYKARSVHAETLKPCSPFKCGPCYSVRKLRATNIHSCSCPARASHLERHAIRDSHAELRLNRSRASFDASAIPSVLPRIFSRPVSKLMHNGQLWYVNGPDPSVLDAVKDMVLRGQVRIDCQSRL